MDRTAVIATASSYIMHGLVEHDGAKVKAAPDVYRVENGWDTGDGLAKLCANLKAPAMLEIIGMRNMRWTIQGDEALCRFELQHVRGPMQIFEYFRVQDGLIKEIRANFGGGENPVAFGGQPIVSRPLSASAVKPTSPEAQLADRFLRAVESHDLSKAPLASDVSLSDCNAAPVHGLDGLRGWLQAGLAKEIKGITVEKYLTEGPEVVALTRVQRGDGRVYNTTFYFRLFNNLIREIQLSYGRGPS